MCIGPIALTHTILSFVVTILDLVQPKEGRAISDMGGAALFTSEQVTFANSGCFVLICVHQRV